MAWLEQVVVQGRRDGFVTTLKGRRRYLRNLSSPHASARRQAERQATNTVCQVCASVAHASDLLPLGRVLQVLLGWCMR